MRVTALWGGDDARMTELGRLSAEAEPMDSLAALLADVDAVIVGDRHGGLHRAHAIAAIEAGRPVFVDKPLANSLSDATAIVDAAERRGVPVLSGSALRWQAETRRLKAKLAGLDEPIALMAYGTWYPQNEYGGAIFYAIHTIEVVQELLGTEWHKVRPRADDELSAVRYRVGPHTVTLEFRPLSGGSSDFGVEVDAGKVAFRQSIPLGDDYMLPVCDQIAAMLRNGHSPMTRQELLAPVAMMEEIDGLLKAVV
jgi:predicted dehydrogenase